MFTSTFVTRQSTVKFLRAGLGIEKKKKNVVSTLAATSTFEFSALPVTSRKEALC